MIHRSVGRPPGSDVSKALILRAFLRRSDDLRLTVKDDLAWRQPTLTFGDILKETKLAPATLSKCLNGLCPSILSRSAEKNRVYYSPKTLEACRQTLVIHGPRKLKQAQRLSRLGLEVLYLARRAGRPKRKQEDDEFTHELLGLSSETWRWLARNAPLRYIPEGMNVWKQDGYVLSFGGRDSATRIRRMIHQYREEEKRKKAKKPQS